MRPECDTRAPAPRRGRSRGRHSFRSACAAPAAALFVAAALLATAGPADAGRWPHERDGVILGLNAGGGGGKIEFGNFSSDREGGAAGDFRVGYALDPQIALGFEGSVWTKEENNVTTTFGVGALALSYYPGAGGFFVRGGIGVGTIEFETESGGFTISASDDGVGLLGALGYEWRLTRRFALGPQVDFGWMDVGSDVRANFLNFTVGANWYL